MESRSTRPRSSAAVVLFVLCVGLGAALFYQYNTITHERQEHLGDINQLSNRWHDACLKLNEQKLVNVSLERDLSTGLEDTSSHAKKASAATETTTKQIVATPSGQPDPTLSQVLEERDTLTAQLNDLTSAMAKLDCDMADTQRRLQASEGDRTALLQELKRLQGDRDKLLRQFNDVALVREQLRKLKAEQAISRRLDWIRRGTYGSSKGAELLRKGLASASPASQNYDLNVEIHRSAAGPVSPLAH